MTFLKGLDKDTEKNHAHVKKVGQTLKFPFWWTLKNQKNQNFEKMKEKKLLEISSFYICVPKTTIIWGTVPGIQSETNLFCHFGPFFALPSPPSPHPNKPENQNFEKAKQASVDVILNFCNKNCDKIMYACSNMECKT